jgi:glycosyltransferase involved in cell wall biosynthesis
VCIGNYTPGKGQDLALEAFAGIADRFPQAHLSFHGSTLGRATNRRWRAALMARAEQLGLASRVDFHGFAADPRPLLQHASISLNLSQAESFSLTVLEACAAGLAVIATDCGGPGEIIQHRTTGILVPVHPAANTIRATSLALEELLVSPELVSCLGRAAQQRIDSHFSQSSYREGLQQVIGFSLLT